jgi:ABC-type multidrug transport system ATPase subunit
MEQIHHQNLSLYGDHDDDEEETLQTLSTEQISLTFRNLTKVVTVDGDDSDLLNGMTTIKRTLLHNNSGSVHPGEILAVMGPSGS